MTSNASCTTSSTATSNIISITTSSVTPAVSISASSTSTCAGSSITFTATPTNGGTSPSYQWQINGVNAAGQVSATFTSTNISDGDVVTVTMTSNNACANPTSAVSNGITMSVVPLVPGLRYKTVTAAPNTPIQLQARGLGNNYTYQWIPPVGLNFSNIKDPVFNYDKQTEYLVKMSSGVGCLTVDTLLVNVVNEPSVVVPNAWTPNGDGHNDYLFPLMINITQLKYFRVFNRWGQKVFETNIIGHGWDGNFNGKGQPIDVYTWTLQAVGTGGVNYKASGRAVLLR